MSLHDGVADYLWSDQIEKITQPLKYLEKGPVSMAINTSKTTCMLCKSKYTEKEMSKHLKTCLPKRLDKALDSPTAEHQSFFHILVRGYSLPEYTLLSDEGPSHNKQFLVECLGSDAGIKVTGKGASRQKAEQVAATAALDFIAGMSGK